MKKIFLNVSNHALTADQINEVMNLGMEVMELPENVKLAWANIDPHTIDEVVKKLIIGTIDVEEKNAIKISSALVAGHPGAVHQVVSAYEALGIIPVYAHTERESIEKEIDGKVIKSSIFKHRGFYHMVNNKPLAECIK